MTGERIPSLIMQLVDELRAQGISITNRPGEWCVNFRDGNAATAYVTDDRLCARPGDRGHDR